MITLSITAYEAPIHSFDNESDASDCRLSSRVELRRPIRLQEML